MNKVDHIKIILCSIILGLCLYIYTTEPKIVYIEKIKQADPIIETVYIEKIVYKDKPKVVQIQSVKSEYYEVYEVTAYTAGFESTGKTKDDPAYGVTASGKMVKEWHTVACPRSLKFGTKIYIPYFNQEFTCEDRGSAITEGKLDIYIADLDQALQFGRRNIEIMIIKEAEQ
jgi:3D (Asp-Asp-Asp) domain-containing protein